MEDSQIFERSSPAHPIPSSISFLRAMQYILWGFALHTFILSFLNLQYILPAVGTVLLVLGFRALRRENRFFFAGWLVSILYAVLTFLDLALNATLWHTALAAYWEQWLFVSLLLTLVPYFCLWQGLLAIRKKAGQQPSVPFAGRLFLWKLLLAGCVLFELDGWPALALCILILYSLWDLGRQLCKAEEDYPVQTAPSRISDGWSALAYLGGLLVCVLLCMTFLTRYSMEWTPVTAQEQAGLEDVRADLLALGFPQEVLDDLAPEDLKQLEGAVRVEHTVDENTISSSKFQQDGPILSVTNIAVELPSSSHGSLWQIIHHFRWVEDKPGSWGTDCLELSYNGIDAGSHVMLTDSMEQSFSGRTLYSKEGTTYASPFYCLENRNYTYAPAALGPISKDSYWAVFSFPRSADSYRGYATYTAQRYSRDLSAFVVQIDYIHQSRWWNYPVMTAQEYRMNHLFSNGSFQIVQSDMLVDFESET